MKTFTVKRIINGVSFLKDQDRIKAKDFLTAQIILNQGILYGFYDKTCEINGVLIEEEEVEESFIEKIFKTIKTN